MLRRRIDRLDRADLDHLAEIHHQHAVADVLDDVEVVRDEDVGQVRTAPSGRRSRFSTCASTDLSSADTASSRITRRGDQRQRPGDVDALALAAGQLVRIAPPEAVRVEADLRQQIVRQGHAPCRAGMPWTRGPKAIESSIDQARIERGDRCPGTPSACRGAARATLMSAPTASPSKTISPSSGSIRCISSRAVVDLPQPDSPTMPSVSPLSTEKPTPSTACTCAVRRRAGRAVPGMLAQRARPSAAAPPGRRRSASGARPISGGHPSHSRRPSLTRLKQIEVDEDHDARQRRDQRLHVDRLRSVLSIRPQSGSGGRVPRPRKDRPEARIMVTLIRLEE